MVLTAPLSYTVKVLFELFELFNGSIRSSKRGNDMNSFEPSTYDSRLHCIYEP